jgi:lycopene beta-cyclase
VSTNSAHGNSAQQAYARQYDIIVLGAGCAGLSLVARLLANPATAGLRILLVDRAPKRQNDRTWCFWEKGAGFFEGIVAHQWAQLQFYSNAFSGPLQMGPYRYKMIRGIDFYNHCFSIVEQHPSVTVVYDEVLRYSADAVQLGGGTVRCNGAKVFSSLYRPAAQQPGRYYLLQHFKGWLVETPTDVFDTANATLMDFRVGQQHGPSFVYVMPLAPNRALVEYTLFTEKLLQPEQYDAELADYINRFLGIGTYSVGETEFGVIPMTSAPFAPMHNGVYHIGTAGGQTKASTGYTFQFIQKQTAGIVANLALGRQPLKGLRTPYRYRMYDNTLLRVLADKKMPGDVVFARLFSKNKAAAIFKFLDNETGFWEEIKIMSTVPQGLFIKAAMAEMRKG